MASDTFALGLKGSFLFVSDDLAARQKFESLRESQGYKVRCASTGSRALILAQKESPDLVMLDVRLPNVDRLEIFRRLKANPRTAHVPVFFIGPRAETDEKVKEYSAGGVDVPPPVPASHLPRSICAFDIETAKTTLRKPEGCEIACAGVLVYKRVRTSWRQADYRWFGAGELPQLETFLRGFSGLIIGHNVFDFDYRVLRPHIPLKGIVEKTVDLRLILAESLDSARNARLTLASLAHRNLGRRKLHDSRTMPALWRAGKRQIVLSHNKRDCELTAELWIYLLRQREVCAASIVGVGLPDWYTLTPKALAVLAGHIPQLTSRKWLARIEQWGNAVHPPNHLDKRFVEEPNLGRHPLFHQLHCYNCGRRFILVARRKRWFRQGEKCACPFCTCAVPLLPRWTLKWQRKNLGECTFWYYPSYPQPSRVPARYFPDQTTARSWINRLRMGNWWP